MGINKDMAIRITTILLLTFICQIALEELTESLPSLIEGFMSAFDE